MRTLSVFCLLSGLAAAFGAEPMSFPPVPATPPGKAEATFETLHGFRMELLAAEPQVTDPVALAYDADGNAYVAEMNDYPYTDKAHHKASQENPTDAPIGRIRLLAEADAEGHFKRSTVFADGLSWPTGIACWKGGIIVTATPDVWYMKDTDGDGVADVRQKLIAGFKKLNVQAVMNNPVWGLDNRLYLAGGSNGGEIATPGGKPLAMRRADVRLDPRDMSLALVSGGARFGNSRDDWGNRFLCNIRNPAQHIVIESRYLSRNPFLPAVSPLVDVAESGDQIPVHRASPPEAWRELRAKRWSADATVIAHMPRSELTGAGVVTSSSGITVYRGDAYPPEYRGNLFVADVAGNLFYRLVAELDGVSFKAKRVDGDHEFCAGRDLWFRPVNFTNAPDGCLHVCDMYREVIEHPWSLPEDIHAALDLERGRDKGRLYRLAPPGFNPRPTPKLSEASTADLVALLTHPNAWHRDTAHRLLFERQDQGAVPALRELLKHPEERARLHALWTLQGLAALSEADLSEVMADSGEHVRAAAVLLAEPLLKGSKLLCKAMLGLASDSSATVRFQVALSLGEAMDETAVPALAAIARRDIADPWIRTAVLSASGALTPQVGMALMPQPDSPAGAEFLRVACLITGAAAREKDCTQMLGALAQASASHPLMTEAGALGMAAGLGRHSKSPRDFATAEKTRQWLDTLVAKAGASSIELFALADFAALQSAAPLLLAPAQPDALRIAFVQRLQERREVAVPALLLASWPAATPAVREASATALLSRKKWLEALLEAVEKQQVKPAELSPAVRAAIQRSPVAAVRERAAKLFTAAGSRVEVLARYQPVLTRQGNAVKGYAVYTAICGVCHRKGNEGRDFGPNLATVGAWSTEQLLTNILDPNREVSPNFMLYTFELKDGRTLSGIIAAETDSGLVVKGMDGTEQSLPHSSIATLKATGISPMPEGLEATVTVEQMADLMSYLRDAP